MKWRQDSMTCFNNKSEICPTHQLSYRNQPSLLTGEEETDNLLCVVRRILLIRELYLLSSLGRQDKYPFEMRAFRFFKHLYTHQTR